MGGHSELSLKQAQRLAVAAQGLSGPRSESLSGSRRIQQVFQEIGQAQVDSVNVVCRAHYQPLFARLGNYRRDQLDELVAAPGSGITEYWAHEASFVRTDLVGDLRRWRAQRWVDSSDRFTPRQRKLVTEVLDFLEHRPGSTAREISAALQVPALEHRAHWGWNWNDTKLVTEALFWQARILSLGRNRQFERCYAPAGHIMDPELLHPQHTAHESLRRLVLAACRSLGVATVSCLAEYYRLPVAPVRQAVAEMAHDGSLQRCTIESVRQAAYMLPGTRIPARTARFTRILSPFDSMVFNRRRLRELFNFDYRIEIYVPAAQRRYGYYVFPVLDGHEMVGRVDLKADRAASQLCVNAVYLEGEATPSVAEGLDAELWRMARWLGLETVTVGTGRALCTAWRLVANLQARG